MSQKKFLPTICYLDDDKISRFIFEKLLKICKPHIENSLVIYDNPDQLIREIVMDDGGKYPGPAVIVTELYGWDRRVSTLFEKLKVLKDSRIFTVPPVIIYTYAMAKKELEIADSFDFVKHVLNKPITVAGLDIIEEILLQEISAFVARSAEVNSSRYAGQI